jgi:metal-dependent amidase/aminoacylase/carboxypeptidase family protein
MGLARVTDRLPGSVVLLGTPAEESGRAQCRRQNPHDPRWSL